MLQPGGRPTTLWVHYTTSCNTQSSVPEDGQNNCPKHIGLTGIINKLLLLHLVGCLYYLYQWCTVKQIWDNEMRLLIKYIKSVLWRATKRLSYVQDARCLKVNHEEWGSKLLCNVDNVLPVNMASHPGRFECNWYFSTDVECSCACPLCLFSTLRDSRYLASWMQKYVLYALTLWTFVSCSSLDVTDSVLSSYKAAEKRNTVLCVWILPEIRGFCNSLNCEILYKY